MTGVACRAIAGCFALAAFSVAVVAGLAGGNTAAAILVRALIAMIACYPLGMLVGVLCRHVIEKHLAEQSAESAESAEKVEDVTVV